MKLLQFPAKQFDTNGDWSILARDDAKKSGQHRNCLATIEKGMKIIEHAAKKSKAKLRDEEGALLLGGENTPLHRESPWRKGWRLMKDGDLWGKFSQSVQAKNPAAVSLS